MSVGSPLRRSAQLIFIAVINVVGCRFSSRREDCGAVDHGCPAGRGRAGKCCWQSPQRRCSTVDHVDPADGARRCAGGVGAVPRTPAGVTISNRFRDLFFPADSTCGRQSFTGSRCAYSSDHSRPDVFRSARDCAPRLSRVHRRGGVRDAVRVTRMGGMTMTRRARWVTARPDDLPLGAACSPATLRPFGVAGVRAWGVSGRNWGSTPDVGDPMRREIERRAGTAPVGRTGPAEWGRSARAPGVAEVFGWGACRGTRTSVGDRRTDLLSGEED